MQTIAGLATARGFASGPAFVYRGEGNRPVPECKISEQDVDSEILRLQRARAAAHRDIESLIQTLRQRSGREDVAIFEGHQMILEDPIMQAETDRYVREERLNAEAAVRKLADKTRAQFGRMNDQYFRERVRDIDDVERRLQAALAGFGGDIGDELKAPCVVVADDLTPSEIVRMPREYVLGFATNCGSGTSHVALLARAMGIPAVTGLGSITDEVSAGDEVLLDGTAGVVTVRPDAAAVRDFNELVERQRELTEGVGKDAPAGTLKGGGEILLYANVQPGIAFDSLKETGARGIGLYRSEYLWLNRELEPTEAEQFAAYREAADYVSGLGKGATAAIRMLDIGGDKTVAGISAKEANPFLGNRSIRYLLSNRDVFRTQLRAVLRASAFGPLEMIYPMIACVEELRESQVLLAEVKRRLDAEGVAYDPGLPVGAMIEVPSAAINAAAIARYVDFFSIGTNDLIQYTMAADRGNKDVANLYQPLNPAILKLMRGVFDAARARGLPVSVCGESASDPVAGVLWAALGATTLSMSATCIPVISRVLSQLSRADLDAYAESVLGLDDALTGEETYAHANRWLERRVSGFADLAF